MILFKSIRSSSVLVLIIISIKYLDKTANAHFNDENSKSEPNKYSIYDNFMNSLDKDSSDKMSETLAKGTLLLGSAVFLSAIGIIGGTDFNKLKKKDDEEPKCCLELKQSFMMLWNDLEPCCDKIKSIQEVIRQLCDFANQFEGSNIQTSDCEELVVQDPILVRDILNQCRATNQVIKRLNAINSPSICRNLDLHKHR